MLFGQKGMAAPGRAGVCLFVCLIYLFDAFRSLLSKRQHHDHRNIVGERSPMTAERTGQERSWVTTRLAQSRSAAAAGRRKGSDRPKDAARAAADNETARAADDHVPSNQHDHRQAVPTKGAATA
jgi:hypothetical protein